MCKPSEETIMVVAGVTMTGSQYEEIAKYVREKDRKDNALNALFNYDYPDNVKDYLKGPVLEEYVEAFSELEDYTGEDEAAVIDSFIRNQGGIVYPVLVSNIGTEDEMRQTVPMVKKQCAKIMEMVREYQNGGDAPEEIGATWPILWDDEYNIVDLEEVNEVIVEGDEDEYEL